MAKRISYNTITNKAINDFSEYHVAYQKIQELNTEFRKAKKGIDEKITQNIANREKVIKRGEMTEEEAIKKYDIASLTREINSLREHLKEDCKPLKNTINRIQDNLPDKLFKGYETAMDKGELSHLTKACEDYLQSIGATNPGGKAASKFAQTIALWIAGKREAKGKAVKEGKYVMNQKENSFKKLFILCMLEILINDKGILVINEDNTLSMKKYD